MKHGLENIQMTHIQGQQLGLWPYIRELEEYLHFESIEETQG